MTERVDQPIYLAQGTVTVRDIVLLSQKEIDLMWDKLGSCGQEVLDKYFLLAKQIDLMKRLDNFNVNYIKSKLAELDVTINFLNDELEGNARRCNSLLQE